MIGAAAVLPSPFWDSGRGRGGDGGGHGGGGGCVGESRDGGGVERHTANAATLLILSS